MLSRAAKQRIERRPEGRSDRPKVRPQNRGMELVVDSTPARPPLYLDAHSTVLVLEPQRSIRDCLRDMFFALRVRMYEAVDGRQARRALRCGDVSLVLVNPGLPHLEASGLLRWTESLGAIKVPPVVLLAEEPQSHLLSFRTLADREPIRQPVSFGQLALTCRRFGLLPRLES